MLRVDGKFSTALYNQVTTREKFTVPLNEPFRTADQR